MILEQIPEGWRDRSISYMGAQLKRIGTPVRCLEFEKRLASEGRASQIIDYLTDIAQTRVESLEYLFLGVTPWHGLHKYWAKCIKPGIWKELETMLQNNYGKNWFVACLDSIFIQPSGVIFLNEYVRATRGTTEPDRKVDL